MYFTRAVRDKHGMVDMMYTLRYITYIIYAQNDYFATVYQVGMSVNFNKLKIQFKLQNNRQIRVLKRYNLLKTYL